MGKRLLTDAIYFDVTKPLHESKDYVKSPYTVEGVLQRAEARNQNGRTYPRPILEREVNKYKEEKVSGRGAFGELDHPERNVVELKNASHLVTDVWWNGNDLMGKVEILETPTGNILRTILEAEARVGISSRGLGSTKELDESTEEVQDDYDLICWDFVSDPSTHGAFMKPVQEGRMNESVNLTKNNRASQLITEIICDISGVCCMKQVEDK